MFLFTSPERWNAELLHPATVTVMNIEHSASDCNVIIVTAAETIMLCCAVSVFGICSKLGQP